MFNQLNNLRFRFILLASLGAPALLVWISGYYAWENWRDYRMVRTTIEANTMADQIIESSGLQALERGVTASLLSGSGAAPEAGRQRLAALRAKSDKLWQDAFATAGVLEKKGVVFEKAVITRKLAGEAYEELQAARKRVDSSLTKAERDIQAAEWIPIMTGFITAAARMRMASFGGDAFPPRITYPNLTAKQSVWLASEYAGLERANIAALLNSNAPAASEVLQRLAAFRQNVDAAIADIRLLKGLSDTPPEVRATVEGMEAHFLGSFEQLRKQLYQEARSATPAGGRHYTLTSPEWIEKSTAAIDTILKVSVAYSHVSNVEAENTAWLRFLQMWGYIALFLAIIVTSAV
ncbi:MAG: nitrate- and nitrite sensing domain-containing protein, partial [Rhodocyclaceae bacterium]|nr:nitrate- and nitrite sensing domain-containing protein [Rhodocyclaceae bacterium]